MINLTFLDVFNSAHPGGNKNDIAPPIVYVYKNICLQMNLAQLTKDTKKGHINQNKTASVVNCFPRVMGVKKDFHCKGTVKG